jgi:hypothetical protein
LKAEGPIEPKNTDEDEEGALSIRKMLSGGIHLFVAYPPNTENGHNTVRIKLHHVLQDLIYKDKL